jgi:hypothetical protein
VGGTACLAALLVSRPGLGWIVLNALVFGPSSLVLWVLAREALRAALARVLGFRVFEIQWGAGPELASIRLGDCRLRIAAIPLLGHTEALPASPRHQASRRWLLALGPALAQAGWACFGHAALSPGLAKPDEGLAPGAILAATNLLLLAIHGLVPVETPSGLRTDVRRALDLLGGGVERDRAERAACCVQSTLRRLERDDLDGARAVLARGLRALGPEPVLVELEDALSRFAIRPQSRPKNFVFLDPRATTRVAFVRERASLSPLHRARHWAGSCAPLLLALAVVVVLERGRLSDALQQAWVRASHRAAAAAEFGDCEAALARWRSWAVRLDRLAPVPTSTRVARHDALARLHGCLDDPVSAAHQQAEALALAEQPIAPSEAGAEDGSAGVRREIAIARQLARLAQWQGAQGSHRASLQTVGRARDHLDRAQRAIAPTLDPMLARELGLGIGRERDAADWTHARLLARMGARAQALDAYESLLARRRQDPATPSEELDSLEREAAELRGVSTSLGRLEARRIPAPTAGGRLR